MNSEGLTFSHLSADSAEAILDSVIVDLYVATHPEVADNPFYGADRFVERVRGYLKSPGFEAVVGMVDGEPVGLALGYALPAGARWWRGLTTPVDPELIDEDGTRTFALCELMVHPAWQGRRVAHALHDELLCKRPERRAALLVREENRTAQLAYAKWGWHRIGKLQPFPDSPHYDALVLDLSG